ncbi:MAG: hypothetical protein AB7F86_04775 [Bdellovibrionales bacterium]
MWWRLFVPIWRFFDQRGLEPSLEFRVSPADEWRAFPLEFPGRFQNLFHNPVGNQSHAVHSLLERLIQESQVYEGSPDEWVSFQLVRDLVRQERPGAGNPGDLVAQFRVLSRGKEVVVGHLG